MPNHLTDMSIDEISLVDDPANEQARVVLVKARGFKPCDGCESPDECKSAGKCSAGVEKKAGFKPCDECKSPDECAKAGKCAPSPMKKSADTLDPAAFAAQLMKEHNMDIETLQKSLEAAEQRFGDMENALTQANDTIAAQTAEIAKLRGTAGGEEDVLKSLPESIRKRIESNEAEIAKMRDEQETRESIEKARSIGLAQPEEVGPLLLRVRKNKATDADVQSIETLLKSAAAMDKTTLLFKSLGTNEATDGEPEAILKAKAVEIQKANSGITYEQAYEQAMSQNPDLYRTYINKRR
jgi:hypothetical protein